MKKSFYSHGKLLLTGEYAVLDGATALAIPTKFGQSLEIEARTDEKIFWQSFDDKREPWLDAEITFDGNKFSATPTTFSSKKNNSQILTRLQEILLEAHNLNPVVFSRKPGYNISTHLDFNRKWGLGTSSTLINNLAQWLEIDPYKLLENTFGGSGYDIAIAKHSTPISYTITPAGRNVFAARFDPGFREELFFVYLNQKQNSRDSIEHYKKQSKKKYLSVAIEKISAITHQITTCNTILEFELLLEVHETIISQLVNTQKIKAQLFPDYPRAIKSLGGWGGDFILATGGEKEKNYFRNKGYKILLSYDEMIL